MKTSFKNIEDIIKSVVAYYVKEWCADLYYNGELKRLPLHPLAVAKHIASNIGYDKSVIYSKNKEVTAHMRTYANIKELNESEAAQVPYIIQNFEEGTTDTNFGYRYIEEEGCKKEVIVPYYYNCGAADNTVVLFLVENDHDIIYKLPDAYNRKSEDEYIRQGKIIAAVEVRCSISNKSYMDYPDMTPDLFRTIFKENLDAGYDESKIYHDTVRDNRLIWNIECIHTVVELFQQYALQNMDDTKFMHEIVSTLPEAVIFKSTKDYEIYSNNEEFLSQIKKKYETVII